MRSRPGSRPALLLAAGASLAIAAAAVAPRPPIARDQPAPAGAAGRQGSERLAAEAQALLGQDRFEQALAAAATAVELDGTFAPSRVAMADALYRRGDFLEAEEQYRAALAVDPDSASAHYGVGRILRTLGRYGDAAGSFSRAAALSPSTPRYLRTLANHLARREDVVAMLRRYLELVRADPQARAGEDEAIVRNVEARVALLESLGERALSEMIRAEPCSVPLQVVGGQPYVRMTVAGLKSQRFVFDTGATGLTVSPRIAARAKLAPIHPFTIVGTGAGRTETGDLVLIDELRMSDGIVIRNVPAMVREPTGPEEGLLGPSFFASFTISVDLKGRRLAFGKGERTRPGRAERFRNVGGQIVLRVPVEGVPLNAMLDTGSTTTILATSALRRVPFLQTLPAAWREGATLGIGGKVADRRVLLKGTIEVAGRAHVADGLPTGDLSAFSRALESEVYLVIGVPQLRDRPFTIDYSVMTITFADPR